MIHVRIRSHKKKVKTGKKTFKKVFTTYKYNPNFYTKVVSRKDRSQVIKKLIKRRIYSKAKKQD